MNRRARRIQDAPLFISPSLELPLVQLSIPSEGAHGKVLTFTAQGLRDYFTICQLEHAQQQQPIADDPQKKSCHLATPNPHQLAHVKIATRRQAITSGRQNDALRSALISFAVACARRKQLLTYTFISDRL